VRATLHTWRELCCPSKHPGAQYMHAVELADGPAVSDSFKIYVLLPGAVFTGPSIALLPKHCSITKRRHAMCNGMEISASRCHPRLYVNGGKQLPALTPTLNLTLTMADRVGQQARREDRVRTMAGRAAGAGPIRRYLL